MEYQAGTWRGQKDTITAEPALRLQMTPSFSVLLFVLVCFNPPLLCPLSLQDVFSHIVASRKLMAASGGGAVKSGRRWRARVLSPFNWNRPSSGVIFPRDRLHFVHKSAPWAQFETKAANLSDRTHFWWITSSSFFLCTFYVRENWVFTGKMMDLLLIRNKWCSLSCRPGLLKKSKVKTKIVALAVVLCVLNVLKLNQ